MSKFRYPIDLERIYTIFYDGFEIEVSGEEIWMMFRRGALLDRQLQELFDES
jgi:hypothetical protein